MKKSSKQINLEQYCKAIRMSDAGAAKGLKFVKSNILDMEIIHSLIIMHFMTLVNLLYKYFVCNFQWPAIFKGSNSSMWTYNLKTFTLIYFRIHTKLYLEKREFFKLPSIGVLFKAHEQTNRNEYLLVSLCTLCDSGSSINSSNITKFYYYFTVSKLLADYFEDYDRDFAWPPKIKLLTF